MASERMGLGEVLRTGLLRPKQLFEAYQQGRVETRPVFVYVAGAFSMGSTLGPWIAEETGQSWIALSVACGLLTFALSPLYWFFEVVLTHGVARLLGGRGAWHETRAAVGLSAAAQLLAFIPWLGSLLVFWAYAARAMGVRALHQLQTWRAVLVVLTPSLLGIVFAFGLRIFVIEAFKMPSGSMFPSLVVGDHFFVQKSAYGLFVKSLPARGDIVVFQYPDPSSPPVDYVKRVIGLPGDELVFKSGVPFINGWEVPRCALGNASDNEPGGPRVDYDVFVEFLEGAAYIVTLERERDEGTQGPYRVEPGEFWVVGDNRNNSSDSRAWRGGLGAGVPLRNLKGKAAWLWFPPERMGTSLNGAPALPRSIGGLGAQLEKCLKTAPDLAHSTPPRPTQAL